MLPYTRVDPVDADISASVWKLHCRKILRDPNENIEPLIQQAVGSEIGVTGRTYTDIAIITAAECGRLDAVKAMYARFVQRHGDVFIHGIATTAIQRDHVELALWAAQCANKHRDGVGLAAALATFRLAIGRRMFSVARVCASHPGWIRHGHHGPCRRGLDYRLHSFDYETAAAHAFCAHNTKFIRWLRNHMNFPVDFADPVYFRLVCSLGTRHDLERIYKRVDWAREGAAGHVRTGFMNALANNSSYAYRFFDAHPNIHLDIPTVTSIMLYSHHRMDRDRLRWMPRRLAYDALIHAITYIMLRGSAYSAKLHGPGTRFLLRELGARMALRRRLRFVMRVRRLRRLYHTSRRLHYLGLLVSDYYFEPGRVFIVGGRQTVLVGRGYRAMLARAPERILDCQRPERLHLQPPPPASNLVEALYKT